MPIYRFLIQDGPAGRSAEQRDLPGDAAAYDHAAARAVALIGEDRSGATYGAALHMVVTDDCGAVCFSLDVAPAEAPAAGLNSYGSFVTAGPRQTR